MLVFRYGSNCSHAEINRELAATRQRDENNKTDVQGPPQARMLCAASRVTAGPVCADTDSEIF
jgi:hypothetical protein